MKYLLADDNRTVVCPDLINWAKWFETSGDRRRVGHTKEGDASVSTVFLGMDHSFGKGPPLLFETMVFGGTLDGEQERYSTWDDAKAGHEQMVGRVKQAAITAE